MFSISVAGNIINVPNRLNEINLYKGSHILQVLNQKEITHDDKLGLLALIVDVDPVVFNDITEESLEKIINKIRNIQYDAETIYFFKTFKLDKSYYGVMNFDDMTVREFMELEIHLKNNDYFFSVDKILCIVCRKIVKKNNTIKNILNNILFRFNYRNVVPQIYDTYEIEKYNDKVLERTDLFNKRMDLNISLGIFYSFIEFRNKLIEEFKRLFEDNSIKEEDKDQYDEDAEGNIKEEPPIYTSNWGYYHVLNDIAPTIMERDYWLNKNIREFLVHLLYVKDKREYELQQMQKQNQAMNYGR